VLCFCSYTEFRSDIVLCVSLCYALEVTQSSTEGHRVSQRYCPLCLSVLCFGGYTEFHREAQSSAAILSSVFFCVTLFKLKKRDEKNGGKDYSVSVTTGFSADDDLILKDFTAGRLDLYSANDR